MSTNANYLIAAPKKPLARILISPLSNELERTFIVNINLISLKEITEIFNNFAIGIGIIAGGLWGYYQFIRGRLFSPRIEIFLTDTIFTQTSNSGIASVEIHVKNTGNTKIKPSICILDIEEIYKKEGKLVYENIHSTDNLLSEPLIQQNTWFLEPQQSDWFSTVFLLPKHYDLLHLICTLTYNKNNQVVIRHFYINPKVKESVAEKSL